MEEDLDQGRRALDEYDFDAARQAFERARLAAPLAPEPLCALLDLLVNRLGLDTEAIDLAGSLDASLLSSPDLLAPLALAAARAGKREQAEQWVRHLAGEPAGEVHRILATAAILAGDLAYATAAMDRARQAFAGHPDLVVLQERLAQARAVAVKPREAELEEMIASGKLVPAVDLARRIAAEHPGSVPARRVLKEAAAVARREELTAALAQVRAAIDAREFKRARQALATARSLGAEAKTAAEMDAALHLAEKAAEEAAERKAIDSVTELIDSVASPAELEAALSRYVSLEGRLRARVVTRTHRKELAWLDEVGGDEEPKRQKLVPAVVALGVADAALSAGDLDAAWTALGPHRAVLRDVRSAQPIMTKAEAAADERRRIQAEASFTRAKEAFDLGDISRAQATLESIRRLALGPDRQRDLDVLKDAIAAAQRRRDELERLELYLQTGDLIRARRLLIRLLDAGGTPKEMLAWQGRLAEAETPLRNAWVVLDHRLGPGLHAGDAPEMTWPRGASDGVEISLLPGGRSAVLASIRGKLVFVRIVGVESGEIQRVLILRAPEPLGFATHGLADNCLWIIGGGFQFLEFSCDDWLPRRWCSLEPHIPAGAQIEGGIAIPQDGVVWVQTSERPRHDFQRSYVIDVEDNRVLRDGGKDTHAGQIPGTVPPLVARIVYANEAARVAGSRGASLVVVSLPPRYRVLDIARHPSGTGFLALACTEETPDVTIDVFATDAQGSLRSHVSLSGDGERISTIATVLPDQRTYVCYCDPTDVEDHLVVLREEAGTLTVCSDSPTHGHCTILQDEAATVAVALRRIAKGAELTRLGKTAPTFVGEATDFIAIPMFEWPLWCSPRPDSKMHEALQTEFFLVPEARRPAWAMERCRSADSPAAMLSLLGLVKGADNDDTANEILRLAEERYPRDIYVRLAGIERDAETGRWTGESLLAETADAHIREHLFHLQGLVLLQLNKPENALEIWSATPTDEHCHIESLRELASALVAGQSEAAPSDLDMVPGLTELVRAAYRADRHLARGDVDGAVRALDQAWIREAREEQTLARLASAHLARPVPADPTRLFRAATALADFVDAYQEDYRFARRLWLCERTWTRDYIKTLVSRSEEWLDKLRRADA
jgi:hypothetical protein